MIQLPNGSVWPWRWTRKKSKAGEDGNYQMVQVGHVEVQRMKSKTGKDGSYHTAQVGPGDRKKEEKKRNGFDWIETGFFKISRNELARSVMGTIFLVGWEQHYYWNRWG